MGLLDTIKFRLAGSPLPPEMEGEDDPFAFDTPDAYVEGRDKDDRDAELKEAPADG